MGCLMTAVGLLVGVLVIPIFKDLYDTAIMPLTVGISDPILLVIFAVIPYVVPTVLVIAAFLRLRRREV